MFLSLIRRGKHFGGLGKIYGEYRFSLAPNEQKPWRNFFHESIYKTSLYYLREYWFAIPLFGLFIPLRNWSHKKNEEIFRKNIADYEGDE